MRLRRAFPVAPVCAVSALVAFGTLLAAPAVAQLPPPSSNPANTGMPARTYTVQGFLRLGSTNQALEMIRVDLKLFSGETVNSTFTRSNGEFEFSGLPSGVYVVEVSEEGYEPVRESVRLRGALRAVVNLYLKEPVKLGERTSTAPVVSARELALPHKAAEALRKGREELFARNNPEGSLKHFRKLAKEAPDFYEVHYYMGLAFSHAGRPQQAEEELRAAISGSQESHAPSFVSLATVLCGQQRYADAAPLARKAVELDSDDWSGHFILARSLLGLNRTQDALQAAQAALQRKTDSPDLHLLLANIYIRRQDADGLLVALDSYLALKPEGPMSYQVRATRKQLLDNMARAASNTPTKQPPPK